MADPTLLDLVANRTMSADVAATLSAIAGEQHSFMVVAVPRFAGKSTVTDAMLAFVPGGVPVTRLSGDEAEMEGLRQNPIGGYLVVGEFSRAPVLSYIWGSPVRKVFETVRAGYSLSTALHAPDVESAYAEVTQGNQVADEDASRINYMVYIERMGNDLSDFWRRIAAVHEVDRVVDGRPQGRLLWRWSPEGDRFEHVEASQRLRASASALEARAGRIQARVDAGQTSPDDVRSLRE